MKTKFHLVRFLFTHPLLECFLIFIKDFAFYLNTCDCIHCYNEEGIEKGEDIFVDDENAGVESQEQYGKEVTNYQGDDQVNACKY